MSAKVVTETPKEWRRHGRKGVRRNGTGGEAKQRETGSEQKTEKRGEVKQGEDTAARGRPRPCRTITGHNSGVWPTDVGTRGIEGDDIPQAMVSNGDA